MELLRNFERFRPFTEQEAWNLFRLAAISEAVGWSLLIIGIGLSGYVFPGNENPVVIAGRIHGVLFITYAVAAVVLYPSLRWSRSKALIAAMASTPPYGSLVFEQWAAYKRRSRALKDYRELFVYGLITDKQTLLAIQTADSANLTMPGGKVGAGETAEAALIRILHEQLGGTARLGRLVYLQQTKQGKTEQLALYFSVSNSYKLPAVLQHITKIADVDVATYVNPATCSELQPDFLQSHDTLKLLKKPSAATVFVDSML